MREQIDPAIRHYHRLIEQNLTSAEQQLEMLYGMQRDRHVLFGDRPMAHCLRPTFLEESMYTRVQDTVYLIRQAVLRVASAFFHDHALLKEELGMEDWEIELASIGTPVIRMSATSRMDSFMTEDSFKFVEINGESPAGIAYVTELAKIYRELPVFQWFTEKYPVRFVSPLEHTISGLLRVYHEEFGGFEEKPAFAIVDHLDVPTIHEFELIRAYLERMGFPCEVVDPRSLECRDGWIYANGRKIDILYRRLLMNEYYAMRDECPAFLEGYKAGKTVYLNTFRSKLVHKKAIFSFLTDPRYTSVLTPEQQYAVAAHIPWTRTLRHQKTTYRGLTIDLLNFIASNRQYFVIKPNDEYGGAGVTLGFASTSAEWETAIQKGLQSRFVVQEVVDIHREPFLMKSESGWKNVPAVIDLDPYLNGPLLGGCLTRISATNLANVTAGGGTLPMFILRNM